MIPCISIASSLGGNIPGSEEAPSFLQKHLALPLDWKATIFPDSVKNQNLRIIAALNQELAQNSAELAQTDSFFLSIGGDHSSAIGVWSGVAKALRPQGELGLIWFDAHMDAHTPLTSETGNIHGMPLAVLLGHGEA
ncbi:MAG: arginase family protein, partial [Chlamydiales bacterium]|nr:arginase family protein [Chlamydiales bacterium]